MAGLTPPQGTPSIEGCIMEVYIEELIAVLGSATALALLLFNIREARVTLRSVYWTLTLLSVVLLILYLDYLFLMPEYTLYSIASTIPEGNLILLSSHVVLLLAFLSAYGVALTSIRPEEGSVGARYSLLALIIYLIIAITSLLGIRSYHITDAMLVGTLILLVILLGAAMAFIDLSRGTPALVLLAGALLASIIVGPSPENSLTEMVIAAIIATIAFTSVRGGVLGGILAQAIIFMGVLNVIFSGSPWRGYITMAPPVLYAIVASSLTMARGRGLKRGIDYTLSYTVLYVAAFLLIVSLQVGGSSGEVIYSISWALVSYAIISCIRRLQEATKAVALAAVSSVAVTIMVVTLQREGNIVSAAAASITFTSMLALLAGIVMLPDYTRALLKPARAENRAWLSMLLLSLALALFAVNPLFIEYRTYEASAPGTIQVCDAALELREADYGYSSEYYTVTYDISNLEWIIGRSNESHDIGSIIASAPEDLSWIMELIVAGRIPGFILSPGIPGRIEMVDLASGTNASVEASIGSIMMLDLESPVEVYFDIEPVNGTGLLRAALKVKDLLISNEVLALVGMPSPSHMIARIEYMQPLIIRGPGSLRLVIEEAVVAPSGIPGEKAPVEETSYGLILREAALGIARGVIEYNGKMAGIPIDCGDWCLKLRSLIWEIRRQEPQLAKLASVIPGIMSRQTLGQMPSIETDIPAYAYIGLATSNGKLYNILIVDRAGRHTTILTQQVTLINGIKACSVYIKPKPLKGPFGALADPLIVVYASGVIELNDEDYYAVIAAINGLLDDNKALADVLWYSKLPGKYLVMEYDVEAREYKLYYLSVLAPFTLWSATGSMIAASRREQATR